MNIIGITLLFLLVAITVEPFSDGKNKDENYKSWFKKEKDKFDKKTEFWFKKDKEKHKHDGKQYQKPSLGSKINDLFNFWDSDDPNYVPIWREIPASPICPVKVNIIEDTTVLNPPFYAESTTVKLFEDTIFVFKTVTSTYPVTLLETVFSTYFPAPRTLTETFVIPHETTITSFRPINVDHHVTETEVEVTTFTLTKHITDTKYVPLYDTVTEYGTLVTSSTVAYYSTITAWESQVVTFTQPISITTKLYIEAPELSVITSRITHPHYVPTTEVVTTTVYETVCNKYEKDKPEKGGHKYGKHKNAI